MVAFGNPVKGTIYPKGSANPAGTFEVTATFQDHIAGKRNPGVDIGNGKCGDPLIFQCDGKVSLAGLVGYPVLNSLTIRYRSTRHPDHEPAATHMATLAINPRTGEKWKVGDLAYQGEVAGTLGNTGTTACHLHMGLKQLVNGAWVEIDGWPYLIQNGATEDDMTPIPTAAFKALTKKTSLLVGANFRSERQLDPGNVIKQYPTSTAFVPSVSANDGAPAGGATPTLWYGGFLYSDVAPQGFRFGWFHSSVVGPLVDVAPDCAAEVKKAIDPLTRRIASIKQKVAANAADVADD